MKKLSIAWKIRLIIKKIRLFFQIKKIRFFSFFIPSKQKIKPKACEIKKILIIRNDRNGDMIVTTSLIRELYNAGFEVYVSSTQESLEIIKYNPHVKGVIEYSESSIRTFLQSVLHARKQRFDLAIDLRFCEGFYFRNTLYSGLIMSKHLIGLNKSALPFYSYSIDYDEPKSHVTKRIEAIFNLLEISEYSLRYELFTPSEMKENVDRFLKTNEIVKKIAVVNPFGSNKSRCLSKVQVLEAVNFLEGKGYTVVLIGIPSKIEELKLTDSVLVFESKSLLEVAPLVQRADLVFSVDTSIVHMASAYEKSTIALYLASPFVPDNKSTYRKQVSGYRNKLIYETIDINNKKRLLIESPVNHLHWAPNNPQSIQVVYDYGSFEEIPLITFSDSLTINFNRINQ